MLVTSCTIVKKSERVVIPLGKERIVPLHTNSLGFPDSVVVNFIIGGLCTPKAEQVTEIVREDSFNLKHNLRNSLSSQERELWVVDDWSASLKDHALMVDSVVALLKGAMTEEEELYFIRFARDYRMVLHSNGRKIIQEDLGFVPNPDGTDFLTPLEFITNHSGKNKAKNLFLFSDGDFSYDFPTDSVIQLLQQQNIDLYAIGIGAVNESFLTSLATASGGFYLPWEDKYNPEDIAGFLYYGSLRFYSIVYQPEYQMLDGAVHNAVFSSSCGNFQVSYKAPLLEEHRIPTEPFIIPFLEIGSTQPSVLGQFVIDSLLNTISTIPSDQRIILRIDGYTCTLGSRDYNRVLSRKRARVIERRLKKLLSDRGNIEYVVGWHGEQNLLYQEDNDWRMALNRRVEIRLLLR
mgnify:CR=1 FL=1